MVEERDEAEDRDDESIESKSEHQRETGNDQIHRRLNANYHLHVLELVTTLRCINFVEEEEAEKPFLKKKKKKKKEAERVETLKTECVALGTMKHAFATLRDKLQLSKHFFNTILFFKQKNQHLRYKQGHYHQHRQALKLSLPQVFTPTLTIYFGGRIILLSQKMIETHILR